MITKESVPDRYVQESKPKCLKPTCWRKARTRGLCNACNASAWKAIEDGKATEVELMEHGKMLPKQRNTLDWLLDWKTSGK